MTRKNSIELAKRDLDATFADVVTGRRALNASQQSLTVAQRRAFVARCILVYRLTHREIYELMQAAGVVNSNSGKPWSLGTISNDVNALRQEWQGSAAADMRAVYTDQLAENRLARQQAWAIGDLDLVLKYLEQEIKLTGTAAPDKVELADPTSTGEQWTVYKQLSQIAERLQKREGLSGGIDKTD